MGVVAQGNWRFSLQLKGLDRFLLQGMTSPDVNVNEIMQASPGILPNKKIPGKYSCGDLVIRKIKPIDQADNWAYNWMFQTLFGPEALYSVPGFLNELGADGITPINTYFIGECWPKQISTNDYVGDDDGDKLIEEVTLSVRYFFPVTIQGFKQQFFS